MSQPYARLPFSVTSPWRLGLADAATFGADDDPRHTALSAPGAVWANWDRYSHPITYATADTPLVTVRDLAHGWTWRDPIPAAARIAAGSDAHMHVITPDGKSVLEFFGATRTADGINVVRRVKVNLAGAGLGPNGGCRAYGGSAIGGLIRGWEIKAGRIDHPLAIALRRDQLKRGPVWPATSEDAATTIYSGPVPMGSYFAIPPSVDLATLGLTSPSALIVARACQEFGTYVTDCSGAACFYLEDDADPVTGAWYAELTGPRSAAADLRRIFGALRVVTNNTAATPNGGSAAERRLH